MGIYLFLIALPVVLPICIIAFIVSLINESKKKRTFQEKINQTIIPKELLSAVSLNTLEYQPWIKSLFSNKEIIKCLNNIERDFTAAEQAKTLKTFKDKYELSAQKILSFFYAAKIGTLTHANEEAFDNCIKKIPQFLSLRRKYLINSYEKCIHDADGMVTTRGKTNRINKYINELIENEAFFSGEPEYIENIKKANEHLNAHTYSVMSNEDASRKVSKKTSNNVKITSKKDITAKDLLFNASNNNGISRIDESALNEQELVFFQEFQKQLLLSKLQPDSIWLTLVSDHEWQVDAYSKIIGKIKASSTPNDVITYLLSYNTKNGEKQISSQSFDDVIIAIPLWVRYIKKLHNNL